MQKIHCTAFKKYRAHAQYFIFEFLLPSLADFQKLKHTVFYSPMFTEVNLFCLPISNFREYLTN